MQDILLRVFVVALSLLTYPRDDPGLKERDDITAVGIVKHEARLLRGGDELDHEMAPVRQEMTYPDQGLRDDDINIPKEQKQSDQRVTEKDQMSVLKDAFVTKHDSEEDSADLMLLPEGGRKQKGEDIQTEQQEKIEEKEGFNSRESPLSHIHTKTSENETSDQAITDWDGDYIWYIWNTFSIISVICLVRKYLGRDSQIKQEETRTFPVICTAAEVPLPGSKTLQRFHSKCIQVSFNKKWREFLEGFANDLLGAMRAVCDSNGGMVIEDFQMVDVYDMIVPFTPPDPYSFQCLLWNNHKSDLMQDMQVCGKIKLVENKKIPNGCPCQAPDADDMVCLLHCDTEKVKMKITDVYDGLLCMKHSPFLSQSQVTRWFQRTIKQAWELISHKYDFELNIRYIDAPGTLVVRFRSGKKICFNMNPVVKVSDAHFLVTPCSPNNLDTFWTLSLTNYEACFLENISRRLPKDSCHIQTLEIAHFLLKRQTALSGSSALKDFHFKTALMHLLLTKDPSQWRPNYVACRLRDLLDFMEKSLEKRLLHHVLIGNPLAQRVIELPAEFTHAKTVNLFHPLVVHNCIYRNAVMHFQEMLRNAHMLICDYVEYIDSVNQST